MTYRRVGRDKLRDEALREHERSLEYQNEADIAYIAMMAGVDLGRDDAKQGGTDHGEADR